MVAKPLVSPHDCAGSSLSGHVLRGELKRVVPRDNEDINETWICDRDRFSFEGVYAEDRLAAPMVKIDQEWTEVSWQHALSVAAAALRSGVAVEGDSLGVLVSPNATLEEMYLLQRIARHLGTSNIDHRLRTRDFRDQEADPAWPSLGTSFAALEELDGLLVVGSNVRMEVPILAHRVRKAALKGTAVGFINPLPYEFHFPRSAYVEAPLAQLSTGLAATVAAAAEITGNRAPASLERVLADVEAADPHRAAAAVLAGKPNGLLLMGQMALRHPGFADLRALAAALCGLTGATLGYLPEGANAVGGALTGLLPHRGLGGRASATIGLDAHGMIVAPRNAYLIFGLEPEEDMADGELAGQGLRAADSVICISPYVTDRLLECADVLLPVGTFAETAGTFVNAEGRWQSFDAAARPFADSRPGWRVLRVLGNELGLPECDYQTVDDVRAAAKSEIGPVESDTPYQGRFEPSLAVAQTDWASLDVPMYAIDGIVRRAGALQATRVAREAVGRGPFSRAVEA
jgi:NADH-quinone oxidoreductase subunit G